jgi:hypothetical protein
MCAQGIAQIEGNVLVYVSMARLIFSHTQETSPVETSFQFTGARTIYYITTYYVLYYVVVLCFNFKLNARFKTCGIKNLSLL